MDETISHYRLIRRLGAGGMGEVYLAEDTRLERRVALKLLSPEFAGDEHHRRRFLREARAASALNHPNVCVLHEVGETGDGRPYIAMEFIEGRTLREHLEEAAPAIVEVVDIAAQVADALDAAHSKGIVHRDVKPANISVNDRGQVKVLDFGLAKRIGAPEGPDTDTETGSLTTSPGTVLGTPAYMSPEQTLGHVLDARSDIFSLGVVLYELVTGRLPFPGSTFAEMANNILQGRYAPMARFNFDVPPELERIARKCLRKNPEERYQSARELLIDLGNLRRELEEHSREVAVSPAAALAESTIVAAPPPPSSSPAASPEELGESDIFISYAAVDDHPLSAAKQGWISQFHRNLEVRVEQLTGERVKIWRQPTAAPSGELDEKLLEQLPRVKTLVSIVSPPFIKSEACRRQVEAFCGSAESARSLRLASGSRVFKVVKRPVPPHEMPPRLAEFFSELLDFEFFEVDPATGRVREYDDSFDQTAIQRYHERVYDLAQGIVDVLREIKADAGSDAARAPGARRTVYLATTTSDLEPQRDRIRRELAALGHDVLPDRPLPLVAADLETAVHGALERCELSVHPIGSMYGVVPEGGERSILEVQNRLAAERAATGALGRLIWIPRGLEARDPRQERWIDALRRDPDEHRGADIVEDRLEILKTALVEKLEARRDAPCESGRSGGGPPRVYLICDRRDEEAVEALEDFFYEQGIEVGLPAFEADESEFQEIHKKNLGDCDAALIYYGAGGKHWVDFNVRDLLKAAGYRADAPIRLKAVYLAPPFDRRKERFRSLSVDVIRQEGDFDPAALSDFVERMRA